MKNKTAVLIASTILTLTTGSLPSHALNSAEYSASNSGTSLKTVNLDNSLNQTSGKQDIQNINNGESTELIIARAPRGTKLPPKGNIKSTFRRTCSNERIQTTPDAVYLKANCLDYNKNRNKTSLEIRGIDNNDGYLVSYLQGPWAQPSTFQRSCKNIRLRGNSIYASCRKRNQKYRRTSILLKNIDNRNGKLVQS